MAPKKHKKHHNPANVDNIVVLKKANSGGKAVKKEKKDVNEENLVVGFEKTAEENEPIIWQAPEYEYNPKDVSWYWMSIIVAIVLIGVAFWQKNFLFAVFVVIAELIVIYFSNSFPKIWNFKLDDKGIHIGNNLFYPISDLKSFDIHDIGEEYKELVFKLGAKLKPNLKVFIHSEDEVKIKEKLLKFLPQEDLPVSLADSLERFIRF